MKQSNLSKYFVGAISVIMLTLSACGKKDDSKNVRVAPRGGDMSTSTMNGPSNGGGTYSGGGTVINNLPSNDGTCANNFKGPGDLSFNDNGVRGLLSASIDPNSFYGICRVNFFAVMKVDGNGNLLSGSYVLLQVVDAWSGQQYQGKTIQPYEIYFNRVTNGSYNRNTGQFNIQFGDNLGSFTLSGQVNGATVNGTASFQNNTSVVGGSPLQGTLGNFSIPAANFMN